MLTSSRIEAKGQQSRIAILGASRGLGAAIAHALKQQQPTLSLLLVARKEEFLDKVKSSLQKATPLVPSDIATFSCDFSKHESGALCLARLSEYQPTKIFYVAGGGPYGEYGSKDWKDHMWAFYVNFLTPAFLVHEWCKPTPALSATAQFVCVGSGIADSHPDAFAGSYAAAKHALKGLITSIQKEDPRRDLRLFSPGYIDTSLLPPQAAVRLAQEKLLDPNQVAQNFVSWSNDPLGPKTKIQL